MEKYKKIEERCIEDLSNDYVPLNDIIREFSGYEKLLPSENEFFVALEFLEYLIDKYNLKSYEGPGVKIITKPSNEFIEWLKQKWRSGHYSEISYGIWFEK